MLPGVSSILSAALIKVKGPEGGFIKGELQVRIRDQLWVVRLQVISVDTAAYAHFAKQSYAQVAANAARRRAGWGSSQPSRPIRDHQGFESARGSPSCSKAAGEQEVFSRPSGDGSKIASNYSGAVYSKRSAEIVGNIEMKILYSLFIPMEFDCKPVRSRTQLNQEEWGKILQLDSFIHVTVEICRY